MQPRAHGRYAEGPAVAYAQRWKAERRARVMRRQNRFYRRFAVWVVRNMTIGRVEKDWRVRLITGPDTRTAIAFQSGSHGPAAASIFASNVWRDPWVSSD